MFNSLIKYVRELTLKGNNQLIQETIGSLVVVSILMPLEVKVGQDMGFKKVISPR